MNNISSRKQSSFIKEKMENDLSTDLCKAVEKNDLKSILDLISKGANVNDYDKNNKLPLQIAIKKEFIEIIEELIQKGADINVKVHDENRDKTLVEYAMKESNANIVTLLVEKGATTLLDNDNKETVLHYAAKNGVLELVKSMINKGINVDIRTNEGLTPLHVAANNGRFEIVRYLCDLGADVNALNNRGSTPLHFAVNNTMMASEIIKYLIDNGAEIDIENKYGNTPLRLSIHDKNFEVAKLLIEKGANINKIYTHTHYARTTLGGTLLHWAARQWDMDIIKFLIENGADINATEYDGRTPLCLFVKHSNDPEMVKFFVEHGADLNNKRGGSPLYWAIYIGNLSTQIALIELGLDVNAPIDSYDELKAPLHVVKDVSVMQLLIDKGANVNIIDKYGNTPLHHAHYLPLVKCLVEHGADINARNHEGCTPLHTAYDFPIVEYLVENGADIHAINLKGYTPLHFASDIFTAEYLVEQGANVKAVTKDGKTVLHGISELDSLYNSRYSKISSVVNFFLDKGISVNDIDKNGNTPLHICSKANNISVAEELLKKGANISAINNEGKKPEDYGYGLCVSRITSVELCATVNEDTSPKEIQLFLHKSYLFNITLDSRKTTLLHLMVQKCNASIIQHVFRKLPGRFGFNVVFKNNFVNAQDIDHWIPLHYAAQRGNNDIVTCLLQNGSMYNAETVNCEIPLKLTTDDKTKNTLQLTEQMFKEIKLGNYAEVVNCVEKNTNIINAREKDGNSPLHLAIFYGYTDIIRLLLKRRAEVTQINEKGNTALHLASSKDSIDIVEGLLKQIKHEDILKEFVNAQAIDGMTALHIAAKHNYIEIVKLLLRFGASYNIKNKEGKIPLDLSTDTDIVTLFKFIEELFSDAKYGKVEIINKLQNLDCDESKIVTSVCNKQRYTLKDILKINQYKSILEEFSKIESKKKLQINKHVGNKSTEAEFSDESDIDLGFGLFD